MGLHHQGRPVEEMAKNLGRNHGAIYGRLEKLGLQKRLNRPSGGAFVSDVFRQTFEGGEF